MNQNKVSSIALAVLLIASSFVIAIPVQPVNAQDRSVNSTTNLVQDHSSTAVNPNDKPSTKAVLTPDLALAKKDSSSGRSAISTMNAQNAQIDTSKLAKVRLPFIENQGQSDQRVRFYANTFAGTVFVTDDGLTYALTKSAAKDYKDQKPTQGVAIKENFLTQRALHPVGLDKSDAVANYFVGEKENWHSNIPTYNAVGLGEVWSLIDVELHAYGKNVEKVFKVKPSGKVGDIRLALDGVMVSKVIGGKLFLRTELGMISMTKPFAYQDIDGVRSSVEVSYFVDGNRYGFAVGKYDPGYTLVIDPLLASTYIGGSGIDFAQVITLDSSGNVYIAGLTYSTNFPVTTGALQTTIAGGTNAFVSKLNNGLTTLIASTYIGGNGFDFAYAITLDSSGNVYIAGQTSSTNFPTTTGALQTAFGGPTGGGTDGFVSKLNNGLTTLLASTYIGGSGDDVAQAITLDSSGNVYVAGLTGSTNFPVTTGAFQTTFAGGNSGCNFACVPLDAFVSKLNNGLTTLIASTYIGGSTGNEIARAITLDSSGNVYIAGDTGSTNYPTTTGAFQTTFGGGFTDAFVSKFNNGLTSLLASTYIGGSGSGGDVGAAITLDPSGNVYIAGLTTSTNFPVTTGAFQTTNAGGADAYVSKLNNGLTTLLASTYIGGSTGDQANAITLDSSGNVYITGSTSSTNYPTTAGAFQTTNAGSVNAFVSKLNNGLTTLLASTYIGGSGVDIALAITLDSSGNVYIAGDTRSTNYPTTPGAFQTVSGGPTGAPRDAFITKITSGLAAKITTTTTLSSSANPSTFGQSVTFTASVSPSTATGTITFTDTSTTPPTTLGTGTIGAGGAPAGTATFTTSSLSVGSHTIVAAYSGDTNNAASTSSPLTQTVNKITTTTTLSSSPNPSTFGQSVTFTATISPSTATGTVTFSIDGTAQPAVTIAGGTASISSSSLSVGSHTITAAYSGDTNDAASTSNTVTQVVNDFSLGPVTAITVTVGGSASTSVAINSINGFNSAVTLSAFGLPSGVSASFSPNPVTPPAGGAASSTFTVSLSPSFTPSAFTLTITGTSGSLIHSTTVGVTALATSSGITNVIGQLLAAGFIDNSGIANALNSKLSAAQAAINAGDIKTAINTLGALINQLQAQSGKHISTSATIGGVTFNPVTVLISDAQSLINSLTLGSTPNPLTGFVLTTSGSGISGATVSILDSLGNTVATGTTDVTGFYYFATTGVLTQGNTYTVKVTGFPAGFTTSSPASQTFTWGGTALTLGNFVLS